MLFMTAKVNIKKIVVYLGLAVLLAIGMMMLFHKEETVPTAAVQIATNDDRVHFLKNAGWEVSASPAESGQVRIPDKAGEVFTRYNALQKSQGYDLTAFGGKHVMRYVYKVSNYPDATEPVYATLLIYKNQVIGGDITDTAPDGRIQGLQKVLPEPAAPTSPSAGESGGSGET